MNKELKQEVKEILEDSKLKYSSAGYTCAICNEKELEEEFEIIREVYKKKLFDTLEWEIRWK